MKIILTQDHPHLGTKNTIQDVKPGYAQNHLLPKGLAIVANPHHTKIVQENVRQASYREKRRKEEAQALAQKIQETSFLLKVKATDHGKVFGAITPIQIASMLSEQHIPIESKQITLPTPIKEVGKNYEAHVQFPQGIQATLHFDVEALTTK